MTTIDRTAFAAYAVVAGVLGWAVWMRNSSPPPPPPTVANEQPAPTIFRPKVSDVEKPPSVSPAPNKSDGIEEEVVGIGAEIEIDNQGGALRILRVIPSSPADQAGLAAGQMIEQIDGRSTRGLPLPECVALIRGLSGTRVRLELFDPRRAETLSVELIRAKLQL